MSRSGTFSRSLPRCSSALPVVGHALENCTFFGLGFGTEFPEKYGPTGNSPEDSNGSDQRSRKCNQ